MYITHPRTTKQFSSRRPVKPPSKEQQAEAMEGLKSDLADISNMLNKSAQTEEKFKSVPWGTFIKNTFSKSKQELFNMATSFVCLVLAFQVMSQNFQSRRLKMENEELVKERDALVESLECVKSEDFLKGVVDRCLGVFNDPKENASYWTWLFGTHTQSNVTEEEIMLRSILHEEIKKVLSKNETTIEDDDGTALITNMLESLQAEGGGGEIQNDVVEIDVIESEDGNKIQRTRKYMM